MFGSFLPPVVWRHDVRFVSTSSLFGGGMMFGSFLPPVVWRRHDVRFVSTSSCLEEA
jgi:hypothetical protein